MPQTPALAPAVVARLRADRAARRRPIVPSLALWGRRRTLALAAAAVLGLLALAFGARYVLGAAEVRVQPGVAPSGPPLGPESALGAPVSLEQIRAAIGFELRLPMGRAPDAAYGFDGPQGGTGALLAWEADRRSPELPGTPWGLVLIELPDDDEAIVKTIERFQDMRQVRVAGGPAFWIDAPHQLVVVTDEGEEAFTVEGNVLIWSEGGVTFRMETALGQGRAIALAESIG
jgi:hypothetical protein